MLLPFGGLLAGSELPMLTQGALCFTLEPGGGAVRLQAAVLWMVLGVKHFISGIPGCLFVFFVE